LGEGKGRGRGPKRKNSESLVLKGPKEEEEGEGWRAEVEGGGWRVEGGGWRVEGGGWRVEGGGWRVEGGGWRVEGGGWRGEERRERKRGGRIPGYFLAARNTILTSINMSSVTTTPILEIKFSTNFGARVTKNSAKIFPRSMKRSMKICTRREKTMKLRVFCKMSNIFSMCAGVSARARRRAWVWRKSWREASEFRYRFRNSGIFSKKK
jgi:hypothetical protein